MKDVIVEKRVSEAWVEGGSAKLGFYRAGLGKRLFDLVLCLCLAPVILPVIAFLWLCIAIGDGAPIFRHTRIGKDGKPFPCMKFRSMDRNAEALLQERLANDPEAAAEWKQFRKLKNDPRITKIGRFIRKTSLDELPQYFNVLRGEMSFVGPRPITAEEYSEYLERGGWAYSRLRPGITGPWQVSVRHEAPFGIRLEYDERYLEKMSPIGDLAIMMKTVSVVFSSKGA